MKLFLVGILFFTSSFVEVEPFCDELKFDLEITHTSEGLDNGKIEVTILKGESNVTAFLVGDTVKKNRLGVKLKELSQLPAGTYILILENDICSQTKRDIVIK